MFMIKKSDYGGNGLFFKSGVKSITVRREEWIQESKVTEVFGKEVPLLFYFLHLKFNEPASEYFKILPKNIQSPLLWDKNSIEYRLLETTGMLLQVEQKKKSLHRLFEKWLSELLHWFPSISFEDFLVADQLVKSRSMEIEDGKVVVIPWIDASNHSATPNAAWKVEEEGMELFLTKDIDTESQEILISYGPEKGNQSLFFGYHFAIKENPVRQLLFPVVAWEDDTIETIHLKRYLLKSWEIDEKIEIFDNNLTSESVTALLLSMSPRVDEYLTGTTLGSPEDLVEWLISIKLYEITLFKGLCILQETLVNLNEGCIQELDVDIEINDNIRNILNLRETNVRDINTFLPILRQRIGQLAELPPVQEFISNH